MPDGNTDELMDMLMSAARYGCTHQPVFLRGPYFYGEYIPLFDHPVLLHFSRQSLHLLSSFTLYTIVLMLYINTNSEILLLSYE